MPPVLLANAAPSISVELGAAVAWLLGALVVLFGIIAWFLRREITRNDDAHRELRADVKVVETDVKKLLAGDVPWVAAIDSRFAAIDSRFAAIDLRFVDLDSRFAAIDLRFVDLDSRFAAIDSRFVAIDSRFVDIDSKLVDIDSKLAGIGDLMSRRAPAGGHEQRSE